ncbi:MAG: flagellar hook basal-body protein [Phycisphaeraceae bacterium]|nr:flagellar hook basal-body protein [Phycisphaeraceae bacterium]
MNHGYTLAASGILTAMHRQDVAANNLANIETPGFKVDLSSTLPRASVRVEDGVWDLPSNRLLERLGAGVLLAPTITAFDQGSLEITSNPLDLAVRGDGFFMVAGRGGANGDVRLTRDGRMTLDATGRLVMSAEGSAVLDVNRRPIQLDPRQRVTVQADGAVMQGGVQAATIGLVDLADRSALKKEGAGLFAFSRPGGSSALRPASGEVVQSAVERSSTDAIAMMMRVTNAAGATAAAGRMATIHDDLMNRAINSLGRVVA